MNTFKKWFAEIVNSKNNFIWAGWLYHWIKGQNVWRRNTQPRLNFSFLKNDKQLKPVSHSARLLCLLSEILGTVVERDILMSSLGSMFCFIVFIKENPASHKYFEKV